MNKMEDSAEKRSELMDTLYGQSADAVYQRMLNLDPKLTEFIQVFAYDQVWQLPPLTLREKSLLTVSALVALGKPEQLRWHMSAFLNCGGTVTELRAAVVHLALYCGFPAALAAFATLEQVLAEKPSDG
jgi:4-carboxymuconolactone decarboxylase